MGTIYAICTTLSAGTEYEKAAINSANIKVGDKFVLVNAEVGSWRTEVYLEGHKDSFNSVFFDFVDEEGNSYNIYDDPKFRCY